ncbi:hypothetical protein [uncultured Rikenella sp.]|uniref:hypothetical protein n=1 Tax=uncultured Rikenella sp. TaxID=368003 RepID=UPI00263905FE|nr:hypothetical protein [uncultured Rikenella sp.]
MKKKIFAVVTAIAAGLAILSGCTKDKPYSSYNIGPEFIGLPKHENGQIYSKEEASKLPADQRDLYFVADYLAGWLIDNGYVRNNNINPLTVEGEDLAYNDQVAYDLYRNDVKRLNEVDLEKVLQEAQKLSSSSKLELTTSGTVSFLYSLTRTSTLPSGTPLSERYTVSYSPIAAAPSNPE